VPTSNTCALARQISSLSEISAVQIEGVGADEQ